MNQRAAKLIQAMNLNEHEAVLVHDPSNMFYLSGYTGEGLVLIAQKAQVIVTDFRYTEQAEKQAPAFSVEATGKDRRESAIVAELCRTHRLDTIYYEDNYLTVRGFDTLQKNVPGIEWKSLAGAPQRLRQIKDEGELALIRRACRITGEAFERMLGVIKEGMTEKEIALQLEYDMLTHGADGIAFSTIVAAGANGSLPHAIPSDYKVRKGDMITMDFGAKCGGYCADMTRTFALGQPSDEMRRVYDVVLEAQKRSQAAVMAGKCCEHIDAIARNYIYENGYEGRFGHGLGHSLGIDVHESPRLSQNCSDILQPNQLVTVEPGIYLPGIGGVRIENTVVVMEGGCEALTLPTTDLIIL
ncbi:MAG: aminopeptidase P family protein [Clostridia bacterium]|nr:aminopeptidase P family protein [Clostridia bacterium]